MKKILLNLLILISCLLQSCYKPAEACFSYNQQIISNGTNVNFDATCSENTQIYKWNFGDGTPDTVLIGVPTISHIFTSSGQYIVTLKASRKDGGSLKKGKPTLSQTIIVQ